MDSDSIDGGHGAKAPLPTLRSFVAYARRNDGEEAPSNEEVRAFRAFISSYCAAIDV